MPVKQEVSFPVFLECCQYTTDTFWESIFSDLAYGKAPYGAYISKGFLCCNYKKKEFSYKIENKNAETVYTEVYNLLTKKLGIMSNIEKIKKKKDILLIEDNLKSSRQEWATIRKKNIKELFIELFVTKKQKEFSLTLVQARYLLSLIYVAMMFKAITTDDITYTDGKIISIDGINFAKSQIFFERDLYNIETSFSVQTTSDSKLLSDSWEKYLKDLKKISS
jgi:hypothetical protein